MAFDFSVVTAPFRMQPGLRRVAAGSGQLTPSRPGSRHLREKMAVLAAFASEALVTAPGFDPWPALRAIDREVAAATDAGEGSDAAPAWRVSPGMGEAVEVEAPLIGWSLRAGEPIGHGEPAIGELLRALPCEQRAVALLCLAFEEDFAVLDAAAAVPWLAVCLPSRWAPQEKVGRRFAEVHAPVADNATLIAASESLARLVTGSERWERYVWTISADPRLHQHPARGETAWPPVRSDVDADADADGDGDADADAAALAEIAYFRSERQTFIPVVGERQAVFTIRVDCMPLAVAVGSADAAARVHAALASMSPAVLRYRSLDPARDRLLRWLAVRASRASAAVV